MGVWRCKTRRRELEICFFFVVFVIVVVLAVLIFLIVHKAIHEASLFMDESFRWGGRANHET